MVCQRNRLASYLLLAFAILYVATIPSSTYAVQYSIPVYGRFANTRIALEIPLTPKWAHNVVLNASLVWNKAQVWFRQTYFPDGDVFTFVEATPANVTVNYELPSTCAGFAVGWTDYTFAASSNTIISARTFLDPTVFNSTQAGNATARQYAFRLALHELGRVLGLGSIIDGKDIMDPLGTPDRGTQPPMLSTIDLYAVHVLASESSLTTSVIVLNTDQYQLLNAWSLLTNAATGGNLAPASASLAVNLTPDRVRFPNVSDSHTPSALNRRAQFAKSFLTGNATGVLVQLIIVGLFIFTGILIQRSRRSNKGEPSLDYQKFTARSLPVSHFRLVRQGCIMV